MSEVFALEHQLDQVKELVERREMALRLSKNPDFKKLILEEFMVNEAARYVQTSADPAMGPQERADALNLAQASGHLKRWLSVLVAMGNQANGQIPDLEEAIEQARAEEVGSAD